MRYHDLPLGFRRDSVSCRTVILRSEKVGMGDRRATVPYMQKTFDLRRQFFVARFGNTVHWHAKRLLPAYQIYILLQDLLLFYLVAVHKQPSEALECHCFENSPSDSHDDLCRDLAIWSRDKGM